MVDKASASIERNVTVDALRGVAAFAVVIGHLFAAAYRESPDSLVRAVSAAIAIDFVDWGRFGVTLFFLISGFVVPEYLVRGGAKRVFAVQRLIRIYPTFWASIVLVVVVGLVLQTKLFTPALVLANATLFPNAFRMEWISGVYWTLNIEMIFYALCVVGSIGGGGGRLNSYKAVFLAMAVLAALSILPLVVNHIAGRRTLPTQFTSFYVAFLLSGVLLKIWVRNAMKSRAALVGACLPFMLVPVAAGMLFPVAGTFVAHSAMASLVGHFLALIVFVSMVVLRSGKLAEVWRNIGESSYSLYLFHWPICAIVIRVVGFDGMIPTIVVVVASTALSLWVARLMYWIIERPSIELGVQIRKRLA